MKKFAVCFMLLALFACTSNAIAAATTPVTPHPNPPALTPEAKEGYKVIKLYFNMIDAFKAAMANGSEPTEAGLAPYHQALKIYEAAADAMATRIVTAYKAGNKVPWDNLCVFNRSLHPDFKAGMDAVTYKVANDISSLSLQAGAPIDREALYAELE
jgi:hypothetical protein